MKRGFTLIEILVVLTIIAVLAGLLFPVLGGAKGRAQDTVATSSLRQAGSAYGLYANDHDGRTGRALIDDYVDAGYLPAAIVASNGDSAPQGLANLKRATDPQGPGLERVMPRSYKISFISRLDGEQGDTSQVFPDAGAKGWCFSIRSATNVDPRFPVASFKGQYLRLVYDGSVVSRTFVRVQQGGHEVLKMSEAFEDR